jgi:HD-GYP domain-containing protein (c-di-GMP phosphodiesterase class II)/Tfp pilus assembly protein PilZ
MKQQAPLYNSRLLTAYLKLLQDKYPYVKVSDILAYADIESHQISDEGYWFTQLQVDRFFEHTAQLTGSKNIAREAGQVAASPGAIGAMRQYTLGLLGPAIAFQTLNKASKKFSHSCEYETHSLRRNKVEIKVTPNEGVNEKPYQCENRIGFFEAIVDGFHLGLPKIEHPECIFEGGNCCRYIVTWKRKPSSIFASLRNALIALLVLSVLVGLPLLSAKTFLAAFLSVSFLCLGSALMTEILRNKEIVRSMENLSGSSERLTEVINTSSHNIQLVHEIGQVLTNERSVDGVLNTITRVMESGLSFDCGAILLANREKNRLEIQTSYGYSKKVFNRQLSASFSLSNPDSQGPFVQAFHQQKNFIINSTQEIEEKLSAKSRKFIKDLGIKSFICCPIIVGKKSLGVIAVTNLTTQRLLTSNDINLLQGIAPAIGVAIQNVRLIEKLGTSFEKTLKVLGQSIDARDYLTAGHSEVVTEYAAGIAKQLGQSDEYIKMIRIAGLLHDYGKIGIPDSILKKAEKLTPEERNIINTHPARAQQILSQLPFRGLQEQIPLIAEAHHERWDGHGYPAGLKGEEILLGARIIAVADFFEAITSKRHYRDPMSIEKAICLVKEASGSHFDPRIVSAFITYMENQNFSLIKPKSPVFKPELPYTSRRKSPRIQFRSQASIRQDKRTLTGDILDIGVRGAFISSSERVSKKEPLILTFALPDSDNFIQIHGDVAWINNKQAPVSTHHPEGFAICFHQVSKPTQKLMNQFVRQQISPVSDRTERKEAFNAS